MNEHTPSRRPAYIMIITYIVSVPGVRLHPSAFPKLLLLQEPHQNSVAENRQDAFPCTSRATLFTYLSSSSQDQGLPRAHSSYDKRARGDTQGLLRPGLGTDALSFLPTRHWPNTNQIVGKHIPFTRRPLCTSKNWMQGEPKN